MGEHFLAGHCRSDSVHPFVRIASGYREVFRHCLLSIDPSSPFAPTASLYTSAGPNAAIPAVYCAPTFNGMIAFDDAVAGRKAKAAADPVVTEVVEWSRAYWKAYDIHDAAWRQLDEETRRLVREPSLQGCFDFVTNLWQGHATIDYEGLLSQGLGRYGAAVAARQPGRAAPTRPEADALWGGLQLVVEGIDILIRRYLRELARLRAGASPEARRNLELMQGSFERMLRGPPETFYQALQYAHFFMAIDGFDSGGRIDQYLHPFYLRDLKRKLVDPPAAERYLVQLLNVWGANEVWNVVIGGQDENGLDVSNDLTLLVLQARGKVRRCKPGLAMRITQAGSPSLLARAFDVLRTGIGQPALYNDDRYIAALRAMGIPPRDAVQYCFGGCTETHIAGKSAIRDAHLNLVPSLQLLLRGTEVRFAEGGLRLSTRPRASCSSFEALLLAYERQVEAVIDSLVHFRNQSQRIVGELQPAVMRTLLIGGCVDRELSHSAGGALYNHGMVDVYGIPNVANSLFAIKRLVFDTRAVTLADLVDAMDRNFAGCEALRRACQSLNKYGNDVDEVDACARRVSDHVFGVIQSHTLWRGGRYYGFCANGGWMHVLYGEHTGATADGRLAGTPLANSLAPVAGTDTRGPTAMINSVTKLDLARAIGTPVVNIAFDCELFSRDYLPHFTALVQTYFRRGGMQLQVNVIDRSALERAMEDPESHRDIIVRVAGYCAHFVDLSRATQQEILERTVF